jgi:HTH-type transcriptional regulator/antitoxin HipB
MTYSPADPPETTRDLDEDAPDRESLGAFVRRRRRERGLTQRALADLAGVGLRFVSELESDKPTLRLDSVSKVLAVFGKELGLRDAKRVDLDPPESAP